MISHFLVAKGCFYFPWFSVFCHIPRPTVDISKFSTFSQFSSPIFHALKCVFLIFRGFSVFSPYSRSFSVHFHFSRFLVISLFSQVVKWMFSFSMIFSFLAIYSTSYSGYFKFSTFFSFPLLYISRPKVCILFSVIFSFLALYSRSFSVHFSFFTLFSDFIIFRRWRMMFHFPWFSVFCYIFHVLQWTF